MLDERPTARELLAAVADFLERTALPKLDGAAAFQAKIAVNVLHIVSRELERGAEVARDDLGRIVALLGLPEDTDLAEANRALAAAIDEGRIGEDDPGLVDHLWRSVLARIAIDSPRYPSLEAARKRREGRG